MKGRLQLGQKGEEIAAAYLMENGYTVIDRNVRYRAGEIDIIAEKDEYLVFVEVKTRYRSAEKISPFISMTKAKCNRLRLLGRIYLTTHNIKTKQPRFDVIGIEMDGQDRHSLEHIKNAF